MSCRFPITGERLPLTCQHNVRYLALSQYVGLGRVLQSHWSSSFATVDGGIRARVATSQDRGSITTTATRGCTVSSVSNNTTALGITRIRIRGILVYAGADRSGRGRITLARENHFPGLHQIGFCCWNVLVQFYVHQGRHGQSIFWWNDTEWFSCTHGLRWILQFRRHASSGRVGSWRVGNGWLGLLLHELGFCLRCL